MEFETGLETARGWSAELEEEARIDVSWHDTDIAIVSLVGEHDLVTSPKLEEKLRVLRRAGELLIVDLTETTFLDSSGLHSLAKIDRTCQERGSRMVLVLNGNHILRRTFEISGLHEHFVFAHSREEAIPLVRTTGVARLPG